MLIRIVLRNEVYSHGLLICTTGGEHAACTDDDAKHGAENMKIPYPASQHSQMSISSWERADDLRALGLAACSGSKHSTMV